MPRLVSPTARVKVEARVAPRALPRSLMAVYYLDEARFREMASRLEQDEIFSRLVDRGLVERVRYSGRIPQHRYEEYKDQELVEFFKKHGISRHPDWQQDFLTPGSVSRRQSLAKKYGVPLGALTSVLRYMSYMATLQECSPSYSVNTREEEPDFLRFTASPDVFDTSPHVEVIRRFCERQNLEPDSFNELFMNCRPDMDAILKQVSAPAEEIDAVLRALDKIQVLSSLHFDMREASPSSRKGDAKKSEFVAEVVRGSGSLELDLRFLGDQLYDVKYRFNTDQPDMHLSAKEREFVDQLKAVNQRKTVLCRIVSCLFRNQYRYLVTGDPLQMVPLTQAKVARELHEEEATISRLVRDKSIRTPQGDKPLKQLFRKVADVVRDLILIRESDGIASGQLPGPYTDRQLQEILQQEFAVNLSRRAITYHRNRTQAGQNFYARSRRKRDAAGGG